MYMRLAFAVAAHLEPEVLLIDEVLAVGDAQFQQKCLGKMSEVARHGRTVLFVSHNMTAVNQLCHRAILLAGGRVTRNGPTAEVVAGYLKRDSGDCEKIWDDPRHAPGNERIRLHAARVMSKGQVASEVDIDQEISIVIDFWNYLPGIRDLCVNIHLLNEMGTIVLSTGNTPAANSLEETWFNQPHPAGLFRAVCTLPANFLNEGSYSINAYIVTLGPLAIEVDVPQVVSFNVFDTGVMRTPGGGTGRWQGVVRLRLPWQSRMLQPLPQEQASQVEP